MLLPVSALSGIVVVLGADVLVRWALGAQVGGVEVPTGVVTSLFGAVFLIVLACRYRSSGRARPAPVAPLVTAARPAVGSPSSRWPLRWSPARRRSARCCSATPGC